MLNSCLIVYFYNVFDVGILEQKSIVLEHF